MLVEAFAGIGFPVGFPAADAPIHYHLFLPMKSLTIPMFVLLGLGSAAAQTVAKPGTVSPVLFESTITTQNAPTVVNLPGGGGTRTVQTTSAVRYINRDILEAMRIASLLDGTLTGWTLSRLANPAGVGNLYATKAGKAAVAVPANLLTQPVVEGSATLGSIVTPSTGAPKPNLSRRAYVTLNIRNGASSGFGIQTLKWSTFRSGSTSTVVTTQTDNFSLSGKSGIGTGIISGSFRTVSPKPADLSTLLPGAAVP